MAWIVHYLAFQAGEWLFALFIATILIVLPAELMVGSADRLLDASWTRNEAWIGTDAVSLTQAALRWIANGAIAALTISFACALVTGLVERAWEPARIALRRLVLLLVRPILLVLALPFASPLPRVLAIGAAFLLFVSLMLGILFLEIWRESHSLQGAETMLLLFPAAGLGFALLAGLALWTTRVGAPFIKILLDIFLYISDTSHRRRLQSLLDAELRLCLESRADIIIAAHSLGTVIALDSLINSQVWSAVPGCSVTLLTCGSPLRRFFFSFFPGHIFPASAEASACRVARRLPRFRWLNIYRPWDEVGAAIGLTGPHFVSECSTGQKFRRPPLNHVGYWSDRLVRDLCVKVLQSLAFSATATASAAENQDATVATIIASSAHRRWLANLLRGGTVLAVLAVFALSLTATVGTRSASLANITAHATAVRRHGADTKASVSVDKSIQYIPKTNYTRSEDYPSATQFELYISDTYTFDYQAGGTRRFLKFSFSFYSDAPGNFSEAQFLARVDAPRLMSAALRGGANGVLMEVALRYDPANPEFFVLPDFPPKPESKVLIYYESVLLALVVALYYGMTATGAFFVIVLLVGDAIQLFSRSWS